MRSFKNNHKRSRNRGLQDRPFKRSNEISRLNSDFGNRENGFRRKNNRNNINVEKLILKYNELAREALSNGDKILSENYFQHADHFTRILNDQDAQKKINSTKVKLIYIHEKLSRVKSLNLALNKSTSKFSLLRQGPTIAIKFRLSI